MKRTNGSRSGGGANSKNVKSVSVNAGPPRTDVLSPGGVSQIGQAMGGKMKNGVATSQNPATPIKSASAAQVPMGNAVAASTICGPGGSRTVMRSGQQGQHGPANPGEPRANSHREALKGE